MSCTCARDTNVKECCAACHVTTCRWECPYMDKGCHFPEWRKKREAENNLPFVEPT